jgi:DNA-binding CsgD family transcriptional regulator
MLDANGDGTFSAQIRAFVNSGSIERLTPREVDIARMVCKGLLNKQIAGHLSISEHTVSTHLRRIYAKLGIGSRSALAAAFVLSHLEP